MQKIFIPNIHLDYLEFSLINKELEKHCEPHLIDNVNWKEYQYKPDVRFKIAYTKDVLLLKYSINERSARAIETKPNGKVWEDSCCEFFCSFIEGSYYNFETNCIGTQLLGWRTLNNPPIHASSETIKSIKTYSTLADESFELMTGDLKYEITLIIPAKAFFRDEIELKKGMSFKANFYKCGDKTPNPHFLSWNRINSAKPNFHLPEFFAELELK